MNNTEKNILQENEKLRKELAQVKELHQKALNNADKLKEQVLLINNYSVEISQVKTDDIFDFAIQNIQKFFNTNKVHYLLYDEKTSELVVQNTSLNSSEQGLLHKILNKSLVGMRVKITKEKYNQILNEKIAESMDLHEVSIGTIPRPICKIIERTFKIGWFLGVALVSHNKLLGTLLIIGKKKTDIPDEEVLRAFAGITANALVRKMSEEDLMASEQRMKAYLDSSPDGIFITNYMGDIKDVNPAGAELIGTTREFLIGTNVNKIIDKDLMPDVDMAIDNLLKDGQNFRSKIRYGRADGSISNALISVVRIHEDLFAAFVKNIDDIANFEIQLIQAKNKAEESDKLKSAFLANMSHEIRSPMNGIIGFASLLKRDDLSEEKRNQFIDIINSNSNQLLRLVDDLLDIAKIEANQLSISVKDCDINKLLYEIYLQYKTKAEEKGLELVIQENLANIEHILSTDCYRVKQIITNLVSNSIKFTKVGQVNIGYNVIGNKINIHVQDTGIGIKMEDQDLVFGRFTRIEDKTVRNIPGTGLGLAISKGLANLLNGDLYFESEIGVGSKFCLEIPYKCVNNQNDLDIISLDSLNLSHTETLVLVCEDEPDNFDYIAEVLKIHNIKYLSAHNGKEAIDLVKKHSEITTVLMDIKMPELNGCEATKYIKKIKPNLPVVAQTAYAGVHEKEEIAKCGFDDYITKPASPEEIISIIYKYNKNI